MFLKLIMWVRNECAVVDCSRRPDQLFGDVSLQFVVCVAVVVKLVGTVADDDDDAHDGGFANWTTRTK